MTVGLSGAVLDSSALLACLRGETGAEFPEEALILGAVISSINYAEVLTRLADAGEEPMAADQRLRVRGLTGGLVTVIPLHETNSIVIAQLRSMTRAQGLSLSDRACLALGLRFGQPVLTADPIWAEVDAGVTIRVIRDRPPTSG